MYSRNHFYFAATLMLLAACQSKELSIIPNRVNDGQEVEERVPAPDITAVQEVGKNTKSTLDVDGEGIGTIYWTPADEINVFYGTASTHYVSQNAVNATTAVFTTTDIIGISEGASENIWGLYPYNSSATCTGTAVTTTLPSIQYGVPDTFDDDLYITLAHNNSTALTFYNVCGGIKFSLSRDDITSITFSGNNNEDIAGDISLAFSEGLPTVSVTSGVKEITLTPKAGGTFASGEYYYIIALPTTLSSGFTMSFETNTEIGTFNYTSKAVTIKRSVFSKKNGIDGFASFVSKPVVTNLSANGTANCYIVSSAGDYKFNASVKGNSNESVGTPASVSVLWESFGTSVAPSVGDLVNSVSLNEGYVYFTATEEKGNALIAVKDSGGNILWSWHIWCTNQPAEHVYNNSAGTMMDRNLGAISAAMNNVGALGLLYQWGRKDPFLGGNAISYAGIYNQAKATSTLSWPSAEIMTEHLSGNTTLSYATSHPTTFLYVTGDTKDWYAQEETYQNNALWDAEKTKYDPCPVGWHVPASCYNLSNVSSNGIWADAFNNGKRSFNISVSSSGSGYNFGNGHLLGNYATIWYPSAGLLMGTHASDSQPGGGLQSSGDIGYYWSCSFTDVLFTNGWNSNKFEFNTYGASSVSVSLGYAFRSNGYSVRCQKQ